MLFPTKYLKYSSSQNPLTKSMNNYSLPIDFTVLSSPHVHSLGAEQHCPSGAEIHLHCFPLLYRPLTPSSEMAHSLIRDCSLSDRRPLTPSSETTSPQSIKTSSGSPSKNLSSPPPLLLLLNLNVLTCFKSHMLRNLKFLPLLPPLAGERTAACLSLCVQSIGEPALWVGT